MERSTRQRSAIHDALVHATRPLLPDEVLAAARVQVPTLGIATVYRNLRLLVDEGAVLPVQLPGEAVRYEAAGRDHHHHFQCRGCERVFDVPGCSAHLAEGLPAGFTVEAHEVTLYGRCPDCQARPR